jgi:glucose-6-phosphate 1-dehydrogenase
MPNHQIEPHLFVVFGATSDLMRRKLIPALYHFSEHYGWEKRLLLVGVSRHTDLDDQGFRTLAREALAEAGLPQTGQADLWCDECLFSQPVRAGAAEDYQTLAARLQALEKAHRFPGNRIFYLATPPDAFGPAITGLGQAKLNHSPGWTRLVVEKPFGRDPESALQLNQLLHRYFKEPQIFRIDHYLGKETVQNLLIFRFANDIFEPLWHRNLVQSVQITVAESLGVGSRGGYYEQTGALRDMVQNHLTQLLTLTAMEVPVNFEPEAIRSEKAKVLRAVPPVRPENVVYGQYTRGTLDGKEVPGYREAPGVPADSVTETFVALKLSIENWRWSGVPFYLITGKALPSRFTQIAVTFSCPPVWLFQPFQTSCNPNVLVFTLQPDEGFDLHFQVKAPGEPLDLKTQRLRYRYAEAFGPLPDAYETLLTDVMAGDQTLFVRADEAEAAWRIYAPLLAEPPVPPLPYPAGSFGPPAAARFMEWPDPAALYR